MRTSLFMLLTSFSMAFSVTGCGRYFLDPISSVKEYEVKGVKDKTYEQIINQSGRCDNPQWVQKTKNITWQDSVRSDSIEVSVTCNSKVFLPLRKQFESESFKLENIASNSIDPKVFDRVKAEYEKKKSSQTPTYNENRLKELAVQFCRFPDVSTFPELVNALIAPRSVCKPTDKQRKALETEFSFKYGSPESLLWPFYDELAIETAKSVNLNEMSKSRNFDIEEQIIFTVQYHQVGKTGRRMKQAKYEANVGGHFYTLKVNGEIKARQSYPNVANIFKREPAWK